MQTQKNRRGKLFIDRRLQGKLVGLVALSVILIVLIAIVSSLVFKPESGEQIVTPNPSFTKIFTRITLVLVMGITFALLLTIHYGIRITHRIVGPVVAFNRHLNLISEGNYTRDLDLREKDEFKSLSLVFNKTQGVLRRRAEHNIDTCLKAEQNLDELAKILKTTNFDAKSALGMIEGLKDGLGDLRGATEKLVSKR